MRTVWTIAGFDPSSGAGVTADLMVFAAHGLFGCSCITALTVQSTVGVAAVHPVDAGVVRETLAWLADDLPPAGIKIGMLATAEIVAVVADFVERHAGVPVVIDPVVRSTSGRELLSSAGVERMCERLLPLATWVTPNVEELGTLTGMRASRETIVPCAHRLRDRFPHLTILATGGHLDRPDDLLLTPSGDALWLRGERVNTASTHGTGCSLASALLCAVVEGKSAEEAAHSAKSYVLEALRRATPRGRGAGPVHHLWPIARPGAQP